MSSWVVTTLGRIAGDLRTFQDYDDVEGLVICLELVLWELIAQEHLAGLE